MSPVADYRYGQLVLETADGRPVGLSTKHLFGGTSVHGNRGDTVVLTDPAQVQVGSLRFPADPNRNLTVNGNGETSANLDGSCFSARGRSAIRAAPAQPFRTLLAGQPMLMSQMSAPRPFDDFRSLRHGIDIGAVDLDPTGGAPLR